MECQVYLKFILVLVASLGYIGCVDAGKIVSANSDDFESRLLEIPERFRQISQIAYPDGLPDSLLDFYSLTNASNQICASHSAHYRQALLRFERWAVQMLDSSGKFPSGLMHAHFHAMGNYEECLEVAAIAPFQVQHCMVQFGNLVRFPKGPIDWDKVETVIGGLPVLKPLLSVGLCLPAGCGKEEIIDHYRNFASKYNVTVQMNKYSCTASDEKKPFTWLEIILLDFVLMLTIIVVIATIVDMNFPEKGEPGVGRDLLNCFSFIRNGRAIFKTETTKRPLATLNSFRFLSVTWVIICHHYLFSVLRPAVNYLEMSQLFTRIYAAPILNGLLAVDNFILMNGLLLSYLFLEAMHKGHKFNIILFYLHRLVRILPGYILQLIITMTLVSRYYSEGPLWKNFMERHTENCMESWWTNILFINNYVNVDKQCIPSTWYLSLDMQLHFAAPIFLLSIWRWKRFVKYGIPLFIVLANIIAFLNSYIGQFPAGSIIARDLKTVHTYPYEYITTHNKLGPWFIGLGLGYILYYAREKPIKLTAPMVKLGWTLSFVFGMGVIMSISYFHQDSTEYNRWLSSTYSGLHSTIWAFCISWVIFACETGYGGGVKKFLAWRVFQPLGKLTFVIFMCHIGIQYGNSSASKASGYIEKVPMATNILGEITACILVTPFLSCFYEAPYICLERLYINRCIIGPKQKRDQEMKERTKSMNGGSGEETQKLNGNSNHNATIC
ncbi:nose resistant to fluoxetine protein 6 isoform X3 [Nilaparvata lugens]|uniref:nose resistant to fluoxetine protein 6 isoform X3 n=1 Tax=Nilaparvata lugens TaxID=108931 RepID=UPI00193E618F|nr:nose resistant to fluoxetine protein 6 isoform X3 [Nilaparvata lugens]